MIRLKQRGRSAGAADRQQELVRVTGELRRLVKAIAEGVPARTLSERIEELEQRRSCLEAEVADRDAPPSVVLHPSMAEVYRKKVENLAAALRSPETQVEAAEILRGLVEAIELRPGRDEYEIHLRGDLAGILRLSANSKKPAAVSSDGSSQVALVAGVGFEPTTFRL